MRDTRLVSLERIPKQFLDSYPGFENFLDAYYRWFQENYSDKTDFQNLLNVDETTDDFIKYFIRSFAPGFPSIVGDESETPRFTKQEFLKHVQEFFKTKGTEEAIQIFFKILFDDQVQIFYPRDEMFSVSESGWTESKTINVDRTGISIAEIKNKVLFFGTSGKFYVDEVWEFNDGVKAKLYLSSIQGNLEAATKIRKNQSESDYGFELTIIPQITKFNINNPGYGFKVGEVFSFSHDGQNLLVTVKSTTRGGITGVDVIEGGENYNPLTDKIKTVGGNGYDADFSFTVNSGGSITSVNVEFPGKLFMSIPDLVIETINGSGATLKATSTTIGGIKSVDIVETI